MLRVRLFGSGRLFDGDAEIKLRSRLWTLPLLAYVLLHRGETIPRWKLAFTIWPDDSEEVALQNLRRNLYLLLKVLPESDPPWIAVDADTVAWNADSEYSLDVAEFERLRSAPATLEQAAALYGADLLEEIYDDWIAAERERLRGLYLSDLTSLVVAHRGRRAFADARRYAETLLRCDPWQEDIVRQLMAVRYESGDAAGALAVFDVFARSLQQEMRADPMPETLALRETIARAEPVSAAPAAGVPGHERSAGPLAGREREFGYLRAHWKRAADGEGAVVLVHGDAGIGKTRIVSELMLTVESEGGRVIEGATGLPESGPYQCIASGLRRAAPLVASTNLPPALLATIAGLVPEIRTRRPDLPPPAHSDGEADRDRLFDALARLILALARPRPALLVFEDVHWAGAATIDALVTLARRIAGSRVMMVCTYRDEEVSLEHPLRKLEANVPGAAPISRLPLGPLSRAAVAQLAEAVGITDDDAGGIVDSIFARSEGNPLFATELLHEVRREGATGALAPSISEVIAARVAGLAPQTRTVAEIAATFGPSFPLYAVREASALPERDILAALDDLLDRRLVRESADRGRYEYIFAHYLLHDAVYAAIDPAIRERRHRRIAHILRTSSRASGDDRAGEIALHCERGGEPLEAAAHYLTAARRAARLYANGEAAELAGRALALAPADARLRYDALLVRERVQGRCGDAGAQRADLAALEEIARALDEDAQCSVLERRIDFAHHIGDAEGREAAVAALKERASRNGDRRWLATALESQSISPRDLETALDAPLAARAMYEELGDDAGRSRVSALAARGYAFFGRRDEARALMAEALACAERTGDADLRVRTLFTAATTAQFLGDNVAFANRAREALDLALKTGDRKYEAIASGQLGTALRNLWDDVAAAEAHLRLSVALLQTFASQSLGPALHNLGELLAELGRFDEALHLFVRGGEAAAQAGREDAMLHASLSIAETGWLTGEFETMREPLERAASFAARSQAAPYLAQVALDRGRYLRCAGDLAASESALCEALAQFGELRSNSDQMLVLGELAQTCALAGRREEAAAALRDAEHIRQDGEYPQVAARHRHAWIVACAYRALGDAAAAERTLARAYAEYRSRAAGIRDPESSQAFEAVPFHRAIVAAFERGEWPPAGCRCVVAMPFALNGEDLAAPAARPHRPAGPTRP